MATLVQKAQNVNDGGGTTIDVTISSTTAGRALVCFIGHEDAATTITVAEQTGGSQSFTAATKRSHTNGSVHGQWFYLLSCTGGVTVVRGSFAASRTWIRAFVWEVSGATFAFDTEALSAVGASGSTNSTSGTFTTAGTAHDVVFAAYKEAGGVQLSGHEIGGGAADDFIEIASGSAASWAKVGSFTSQVATVDADGVTDYVLNVIVLKSGATLALDQEGFRWRNDDGSETTATWKAAQDTNVSIAPDTTARLRMLINATLDPPNEQYKLQYRKQSGPGPWRDIDQDG